MCIRDSDKAGNSGSDTKEATTTVPSIPETTTQVANYADVDGNGSVDGVIYADLAVGGSGTGLQQSYTIPKGSNCKKYKVCLLYTSAFWVGGLICSIGQIIFDFCTFKGLDPTTCATIVSITLIGIAALLTGLNIFNKIGKFAGAGSLVPITGFANSIVSPAIEYKSEGYVMGVGGKMFTVAGPVLVFGISASVLVGIIATFIV